MQDNANMEPKDEKDVHPREHHPKEAIIITKSWRNYGFEFLSIFIAVVSAFALNNWNDNKRAAESENKILTEIANGLTKDVQDIRTNKEGHEKGIASCVFFRRVLAGKEVSIDSVPHHYFNITRDFISIQNIAGYETLKSKGLELIKNDSLRLQIISLYEYDYKTLLKLEEQYYELQFQQNYFKEFNEAFASNFQFNEDMNMSGFTLPVVIDQDRLKPLLIYLWKIENNRRFILSFYLDIEKKVKRVEQNIQREIASHS